MYILLFKYVEANRSGESCYLKNSLLLTVPKRRQNSPASQGPQGGRELRKYVGKNLNCGFHGKEWMRRKKTGIILAILNNFNKLWGLRVSLVVYS